MPREKDLRPDDLEPPWTVKKLLRWTAGFFDEQDVTETPRLDADLLLGEVLGYDRVELYARSETPVSEEERSEFRQLVKRRSAGEPVAYLVGHCEFWGLELRTDARALIPRPETEVLVETALELLPEEELQIADVGTGTGAIALALASEHSDLRIAATDVSEEALALASENVDAHEFGDQIDLLHGDLLEPVPGEMRPLDAVVANLPYVGRDDEDVMVDVRDHEPEEALFADDGGLAEIERLIEQAADTLREGGWLILEIGHDHGDDVRAALEDRWTDVEIRTDYSDHDRVAVGRLA